MTLKSTYHSNWRIFAKLPLGSRLAFELNGLKHSSPFGLNGLLRRFDWTSPFKLCSICQPFTTSLGSFVFKRSIYTMLFFAFAISAVFIPSVNAQYKKPKPVEETEIEADDEYFGPNFTPRTGFSGSLGLTSRSYTVNVNYIKSFDPDWMFVLSLGITSDNDPNERQTFDFITGQNWIYDPDAPDPTQPFGRPPFRPKLNSIMMFPLTATLQYRLFRTEITRSFRPFVEFGAGPTFSYVYNWFNGFFNFSTGYLTYGLNGLIGGGAYFGANPLMLQGLSVRYQFSYLPSGVQMLESKGPLSYFGSISLNLTFGTLF